MAFCFRQISESPLNKPIPTPASNRGGPVACLGGRVPDFAQLCLTNLDCAPSGMHGPRTFSNTF